MKNKLYYGDNLEVMRKYLTDESVDLCYIDPPFNSKRDYKLNVDSNIGFTDKWVDNEYYLFIKNMIDKLYDILEKNGTLFFHISSSCMSQ